MADETISRFLLPRLISFVTTTDREDPENARPVVAHTLSQYVGVVSNDHTAIVMSLVVPTLLSRASSEGPGDKDVYRETSGLLLGLASVDQASFRGVVAGMSEGQKAFMEEVIKSGRTNQSAEKDADSGSGQPTIALKMDFGGN